MLNSNQIEETDCPLCHSRRQRRLFAANSRWHLREDVFAVVECNSCRFRFTNPRPTRKSMAHFYPATYGPYQGVGPNGRSLFDPRNSVLADLKNDLKYSLLTHHYGCDLQTFPSTLSGFNLLPKGIRAGVENLALWLYKKRNPRVPVCKGNRKALDVGCGNGHYLLFLRQLGWDVTGFDIENHVDPAVSDAGIPVYTGSLESLLSQQGPFTLISMWHVLEHFHDPAAELHRIRDLLSHGGTLLIEVPNSESISAKLLRSHWHQWDLPRHLSHFTPDSLVRLLSKTGFRLKGLSHLHKTALPQSLRSWVEKEGGWRFLKPLVKMEGFSRAARILDYPLALAPSGENILATAVK
jgi:2-polyprenyl-3-methyl-5-hydroxy-6-metoxy-1,4-benzoquinol methylase